MELSSFDVSNEKFQFIHKLCMNEIGIVGIGEQKIDDERSKLSLSQAYTTHEDYFISYAYPQSFAI